MARPAGTSPSDRIQAPSTVTCPPATALVPPDQVPVDQPLGRFVPENSAPTVGARMTSPPLVSETYVELPVVPALKSATVVSTRLTEAAPVVNDQVGTERSSEA